MRSTYPTVYIIAGPNGSGKTTFASEFLPRYADCLDFVNVDLIAGGLSPFDPGRAAIHAGRSCWKKSNRSVIPEGISASRLCLYQRINGLSCNDPHLYPLAFILVPVLNNLQPETCNGSSVNVLPAFPPSTLDTLLFLAKAPWL